VTRGESMPAGKPLRPLTLIALSRQRTAAEPIVALTAYDATQARLADQAGIDLLLVGDSLGMVVQGHASTVPVTLDEVLYHCRCVARGLKRALLAADLPFLSVRSPDVALQSAGRLLQQGGARLVKLEGGIERAETVAALAREGIPVWAHLGLLPQRVHKLGSLRRQGEGDLAALALLDAARALEQAGADLLLLESIPAVLARRIRDAVQVPVIGIGAGPDVDGQILVWQDVMGMTPRPPPFARDFLATGGSVAGALAEYAGAVRTRRFPAVEVD